MKGNEHYCIASATCITHLNLDGDRSAVVEKIRTMPLTRAVCDAHLPALLAEGDYIRLPGSDLRLIGPIAMIPCGWGK